MKEIFASVISQQAPPLDSGEELPYWTFWLLLCIIMLLVTFIFLRDKDLRRRLNLFFFGAKKKLIKLRLQAKLKRESRKMQELIRELGKKVWATSIPVPREEKAAHELSRLQKDIENLEMESANIQSKIDRLQAEMDKHSDELKAQIEALESEKKTYQERLERIRNDERCLENEVAQKQKEFEGIVRGILASTPQPELALAPASGNEEPGVFSSSYSSVKMESLKARREEMDRLIKGLVEKRLEREKEHLEVEKHLQRLSAGIKETEEKGRKKIREFRKEIKEWKKKQERILEQQKIVENKKTPLFDRLGRRAEEVRIIGAGLSLFYSQIDRSVERIKEIEEQIRNL